MSKKKKRPVTPEWSHKVDVRQMDKGPVKLHIEATPEERKDLARRLNVTSVESVQADLTLRRESQGHVIHVTGSFEAHVVQACVVTLKPVEDDISEPVEGWFSEQEQVVSLSRERRERQELQTNAELEIVEEREDPEPVIEGHIDVGELVTQHISVAINPYPHAEGAVFTPVAEVKEGAAGGAAGTRPNPFAALKNWKFDKDKKK